MMAHPKKKPDHPRRPDQVELQLPTVTVASNGKRIYRKTSFTMEYALEYFSCNMDLEFENLCPLYYPLDPEEFESSFQSSTEIDDFVAALPVKVIYALYISHQLGEIDHEYTMMMRWLHTCLDISGIRDEHLQKRRLFLNAFLKHKRQLLDQHVEGLYDHGYEGFLEEKNYNMVVYLSVAMKVMLYVIISVQDMYMECLCKTFSHHKNQDELEEKHIRKMSVALPPKQFHRRVPDVLCVVDNELYNQPWNT